MAQDHSIAPNFTSLFAGQSRADTLLPFGARPVQDWLALSGKGLIDIWANPFQTMAQGSFIAELRLPLPRGKVLINMHKNQGVQRGFSLFSGPDGALSVLHRDGASMLRVGLPPRIYRDANTLRLSFRFDAKTREWRLRAQALGTGDAPHQSSGVGALPFAHRDIEDICKSAVTDPTVLWFGFCHGEDLPQSAPWIGLRTPVETAFGTVAAGNLKAGDVVLTHDRGPVALRGAHRVDLPARGSFAPVLLRGPFYDKRCDILVSADQRVAISGSAVEYLFGTEAVLVAAGDVVDGHTAQAEDRRNVISAVMLDLGGAALIGGAETGSARLAVGDLTQSGTAPLTCLNPYETVALMRMLGRIVSKVA